MALTGNDAVSAKPAVTDSGDGTYAVRNVGSGEVTEEGSLRLPGGGIPHDAHASSASRTCKPMTELRTQGLTAGCFNDANCVEEGVGGSLSKCYIASPHSQEARVSCACPCARARARTRPCTRSRRVRRSSGSAIHVCRL